MAETEKQKSDRQLIELLSELRVLLPGAQVLLGFLLTVPFSTRFARTTSFERALLFVSVLATGAGVLFLMAPSVYHRVRWNEGGKRDVVRIGHYAFLVGTVCLALGMVCALFVIGDVLFGLWAAVLAAAIAAAIVGVTWYVLPVVRGRDPYVRDEE